MIDPAILREASSKAWWELRKNYKFYKAEVKGCLTTLKLFGDKYKFFFDESRKLAWVESSHHYVKSSNFKLCTAHRSWEGVFSLPRSVAMEVIRGHYDAAYAADKVKVGKPNGADDAKKFGIEAKRVYGSVYRGDKKKLSRRFGAVLWANMDREIGSLCMKLYGLSAGSLDYTIVANNKKEVEDTLEKAPGILPVWRDIVVREMWRKSDQRRKERMRDRDECDFDDLLGSFKEKRDEIEPSAFYISEIFKYTEVDNYQFPNIVQKVRDTLMGMGLTNAGWRFLIKLKPIYTSKLMFGNDLEKEFVPLINWLAEIGYVPRFTTIKPFMQNIRHHAKTPSLTAMVRAGLKEAQKTKGVKNFFENQFMLVLDWMTNSAEQRRGYDEPVEGEFYMRINRQVTLDANQKKASWAWFMRQQQAWHQIAAQRAKANVKQEVWESRLGEVEVRGYQVVPLTTAHDLIDEGKDMHHCVGSYTRNCLEGRSRIFSIRKDGVKLATLEIVRRLPEDVGLLPGDIRDKMQFVNGVQFTVNQVRGHCNAEVSDTLKGVAKEVAKKYTKAAIKYATEQLTPLLKEVYERKNQACRDVEGHRCREDG